MCGQRLKFKKNRSEKRIEEYIMFDLETKLGEIHFPATIVQRIVMEAVESCGGKVDILNYKGKYKNMMPWLASRMNIYKEETGGIQVEETEGGIVITVYVVIHFGTSIKKVTEKLIDEIYEKMEQVMKVKPKTVKVVVTGTLSKNIVKRHIEVSR